MEKKKEILEEMAKCENLEAFYELDKKLKKEGRLDGLIEIVRNLICNAFLLRSKKEDRDLEIWKAMERLK
jgi:hypothetical protein